MEKDIQGQTVLSMPQYTVCQIQVSDPKYQQERELRNEVLLRPIGIPDFGWEAKDQDAHHFVILHGNQVIACAMLSWQGMPTGELQLMQMAVKEPLQGQGLGSRLLLYLMDFCRQQQTQRIFSHVRESALGFYTKQGFITVGPSFMEVGIRHHPMALTLTD